MGLGFRSDGNLEKNKLAIRGWLWLLLKGVAEGLRRERLLGHGRMLGSRDSARHRNKNQKKITPELKTKFHQYLIS